MDEEYQKNIKASEVSILEKQANATRKVNSSLENLNERIASLEKTLSDSSESATKMAKALNCLTGALVFVGIVQVIVTLCIK